MWIGTFEYYVPKNWFDNKNWIMIENTSKYMRHWENRQVIWL